MRTEEWMYRDLGTEHPPPPPFFFFFQVSCGFFFRQEKVLFVWFMMIERHKSVLHTESELRLFHNFHNKFFILLASAQ